MELVYWIFEKVNLNEIDKKTRGERIEYSLAKANKSFSFLGQPRLKLKRALMGPEGFFFRGTRGSQGDREKLALF